VGAAGGGRSNDKGSGAGAGADAMIVDGEIEQSRGAGERRGGAPQLWGMARRLIRDGKMLLCNFFFSKGTKVECRKPDALIRKPKKNVWTVGVFMDVLSTTFPF
jgi:hypothetical protein